MNTQTFDHENIQKNVKNQNHWIRLAYMLLYGVLLHLASMVMWVVCAVQFLFVLGTGENNSNLLSLAKSLTRFIQQALEFVSYNTEQKPFPFTNWPNNTNKSEYAEDAVIIEEKTVSDDVNDSDIGTEKNV